VSLISRRSFLAKSAAAAFTAAVTTYRQAVAARGETRLRLGGPVFDKTDSPQEWIVALQKLGYRAAYCPLSPNAPDDTVAAYEKAARAADILIAEVGAWSNPISPDDAQRRKALEKCRSSLALADRIGANCCVNISGSMNPGDWAGHHQRNLTSETFDLIVETTRKIIDAVKPTRTFFTLETMPWAYPDSADSYLQLVEAIDRKQFAVHLDPVNIICSPQRYYSNAEIIRECFDKLGPMVKSCHAKDIILRPELTTHLDEIRPGLGGLDYKEFLTQLARYPYVPLMLEHLPNAEEYDFAAAHIRKVAAPNGLSFT
jgi:sugar phosphate isomerase/epimerase